MLGRLGPKDIQEIGKRKLGDALDMGAISDDGMLANKLSGAFSGLEGIKPPQIKADAGQVNTSVDGEEAKEKTTTKVPAVVRPNVLHSYSSYTYHLEMFALTTEDYNSFVNDPEFTIEGKQDRLLIKSGGGDYDNRNRHFHLDYFIDNLQISSVISPGGDNIGSTNTQLSFEIREPYGMTLLNAFVLAAGELGSYNYIDQPYMLKISFKGYDSKNKLIEESTKGLSTRYIPIRFTNFTFGVGVEGTTYNIEAVPYHSIGISSHKSTIPANIQLEATTVGEFLVKELTTVSNKTVQVKREVDPRFRSASGIANEGGGALQTTSRQEEITENVQGGLAGYLNNLERDHVKQKLKTVADVYAFELPEIIGKSQIMLNELVDIAKAKNEKDPEKIAKGQLNIPDSFEFDKEKQSFAIRAGTPIIKVIHSVLRTCSYMLDQVQKFDLKRDEKEAQGYEENRKKPINFYRIVPRVELLSDQFDTIRNCWAKKITFVIQQYDMTGKDYENLGQAQIQDYVKSYRYLYTGENTDILNFDIQFNAAYFQKGLYNIAQKSKQYSTGITNTNPTAIAEGHTALAEPNGSSNIFPRMREIVTDTGTSKQINDPRVSDRASVIDHFMDDVFDQGADLVSLNMNIVGDPAYIQTTDLRDVSINSFNAPAFNKNLSLNPNKEWHIYIEFKNPPDYNSRTGTMKGFDINVGGEADVNAPTIDGYYRLTEVRSTFSNGQFSQDLIGVRERIQALSYAKTSDQNPSTNLNARTSKPLNGEIVKKDDFSATTNKPPSVKPKPKTVTSEDTSDKFDDLKGPEEKLKKKALTPVSEVEQAATNFETKGDKKIEAVTPPPKKVVKEPPPPPPKVVENKPKLPEGITPDRVSGGWRAFNPATGKAQGFAFNDLEGAKAFASGGG
tara:strand:- start:7333 stop:10035 length:2703 start_codon:yes stop_codon:yes gene_type:complete